MYTGMCAGLLVATYITVEAPVSGMSMNPARSFGSAFFAGNWTALWIYFTAPVLGMLAAAQLYLARRGPQGVACAKLHHQNPKRCIFCEYRGAPDPGGPPAGNQTTSPDIIGRIVRAPFRSATGQGDRG
jgi:aquaporin Z